ncbi:hypothetical protein ABEV41_00490 [Geobacillus thermodenitrificans]|uniref:hypothetical protein n=1 Tax=Geobacillus thermodenitrificans TaxID=33940 RepID=UPI003D1B6CAD
MVQKDKLINYIDERVNELFDKENVLYGEITYDGAASELLRLKKLIEDGKFNIRIWHD